MSEFDKFKRAVAKAAKKQGQGHLVPDADTLYRLFEEKTSVDDVVFYHCTVRAAKVRATK